MTGRRPGNPSNHEREFTDRGGVQWTFAPRKRVRREEEETHVTLLIRSAFETRVVTCRRDEWDTPAPDLGRLLAQSVPSGGSRGAKS